MTDKLRFLLVKHGAIVTIIGTIAGLVYGFVITGDMSGSVKSWHLAHLQGVLTGILMLAASSYIDHISLTENKRRFLAYALIITGYCYSIGPIWGAVFNVRGIQPSEPLSNLIMFTSNTVASISVLLALLLSFWGAGKKLRT
ncbi:MAG: hypothetical protein JW920_02550 [Deltaproteobacteria bacterium]|nr:hypothetical protein [Deltaproteobacteria bacterium]